MNNENKKREYIISTGISFVVFAFFVLLQKTGLVELIQGSEFGYGTILLIGVIASLSTCMAVVGGFLLSMSASFVKSGDTIRPQILFHFGRFVSFFILGGVIGALGTAFTLGIATTFVLNMMIAFVMLILGFKLLDVPFAERIRISFPPSFRVRVERIAMLNHTFTPFLVGVATFFMPCGFTQSMQLYTLSTGSFLEGALTMSAFALGTFPILALVSFSSLSITERRHLGIFYKTSGFIVIAFAFMNIINSFAVIGLIEPFFKF